MTQSLFIVIPNLEVNDDMFVLFLLSPPSFVNINKFPPVSTYFFKLSISSAENVALGPGITSKLAFFIL